MALSVSVVQRTLTAQVAVTNKLPLNLTVTPQTQPDKTFPVSVQRKTVTVQMVTGSSATPGTGITRLQDDPSPTLGGNLTLNAKEVLGTLEGAALVIDGGLLG